MNYDVLIERNVLKEINNFPAYEGMDAKKMAGMKNICRFSKVFSSLTHALTIQIISHLQSALRPPPGRLTGRCSVPQSHNQPRPG